MGTILTPSEYQYFQPVNNTDVNDVQLSAWIRKNLVKLVNQLPRTMQPIIESQDFTDLPELEAFNNRFLKPWIAQMVFSDVINYSGLNVEPEGTRMLLNPQSVEAPDKRRSVLAEAAARDVMDYRQAAMWEYQERKYVFDDVAYPPTPNMPDIWNAVWAGMSYGYNNGAWGWYGDTGSGAGGSIGPVVPGTRNNPRFGLNLI